MRMMSNDVVVITTADPGNLIFVMVDDRMAFVRTTVVIVVVIVMTGNVRDGLLALLLLTGDKMHDKVMARVAGSDVGGDV